MNYNKSLKPYLYVGPEEQMMPDISLMQLTVTALKNIHYQ